MLTLVEKVLFVIAVAVSGYYTWQGVQRMIAIIGRGQGKPDWNLAKKRIGSTIYKVLTFQPVFRFRRGPSLLHAFVGWGFTFYMLVNFGDVLQAYIPDFHFLGTGGLSNFYRLIADILSVGVLFGVFALMIRRFIAKPEVLGTRESTMLDESARAGIPRDSAIVGAFIFFHVGFRFLGESFAIAAEGHADAWQPFASAVASLWSGMDAGTLVVMQHVSFWVALGLILAFFPYFPYSKHIHLFFAPVNFLLKPERRSIGELGKLDFDDESIEQFGASTLADLGWEQINDAYACIMCFRCQEVCPAYNTGKILSPAAIEINKRYYLKHHGAEFAAGEDSPPLLDFLLPTEAVWACTSCGACVDICPVGNEPMRDILDIRRGLVLMDNAFPKEFEPAFRGMERNMNPWGVPPTERMKWTEDCEVKVPTIEENPEPEILWYVGCAAATDARAQKTAQAFAKILDAAGVNYAVLGQNESCCGDSARRAGNEYLFFELALGNVELFNEIGAKRIVTTCPHGLHTLKNEYPAFGGNYDVVHHTEFIEELIAAGRLKLKEGEKETVTYHDPCYLGRHNGVFAAPRDALKSVSLNLVEMEHHGEQSFCCGAGGAQMWKEEEHGTAAVNETRFAEAKVCGAETLAVGCPFCLTMMEDASKAEGGELQVLDIAEILAARLA
jgi:Fe-S oxidoreductase